MEINDNFDLNHRTFSYLVNFQICSFALNKNGNRIIVAGKSDWELLSIEEDKFVSQSNVNLNSFNLRIMDVGWSQMDESLAASCGSNGELQKLIVSPSEIRFDHAYKFHDRTINKIHFHPNEASLLISGGQDGNIKLIDFRCNPISYGNPVSVFQQQLEDKVTDLQINPSPSMKHQFTSGSETGYVYIWDTRMPNKYEKRYGPFRGIVHLDWHPEEKNWLAVAKLDRQISILETSTEKVNVLYSITNSESIGNIKWRPKRKMQIGACMSGSNYHHLYVWDLNRPYVPYASFDSIINKAENFVWRNGPKCIIASTRVQNNRSRIYNTYMSEAQRPADYSTLVTVEMDKNGSIAFALGVKDTKKFETDDIDSVSSEINNGKFQITQSLLFFEDNEPLARSDWFYNSATNYKFRNGTFEELCDHNANVALLFKRNDDYKNWMILKTLYKQCDKYDINKDDNNSKSSSSMSNGKANQSCSKLPSNENNSAMHIPFSQVTAIANSPCSSNQSECDLSPSSEIESADSPILESNGNPILTNLDSNIISNVLKKETNENYFPLTNSEINILSHLDIHEDQNLINNSHLTKFEDEDEYSILPKETSDFNNLDDFIDFFIKNERENDHYGEHDDHQFHYQNLQNNYKSQIDLTNSAIQSIKQNDNKETKTNLNNTSEDENRILELKNFFEKYDKLADVLKVNYDECFSQLLLYYINEQNDLATPIFMYLVATQNNKVENINIESTNLDEWFSQYLELLAKFELWNQRIEIIKAYQTDAIRNLTQKTLVYNSMCGVCKRTIKQNTLICNFCKNNAFLCSYCHLPVKRLYAWCHACNHGGHLNHMVKWFKSNTKCPTGCGCDCSPNYNQLEQNLLQN